MINPVDISIIIPVLNEEDSIEQLTKEISSSLKKLYNWEIIFVDDGSSDDSVAIVNKIIRSDPRVKLIKFYRNYGKADALSEGFSAASGEFIITMDADLQDDPSEIQNLINKLNDGWDMVSGWKKNRNDPLSKRLPSRFFNLVTRFITGINIHDFNCGLKAYKSKVIKTIKVYGGLHRYIPALAKQHGFTITEIVVNHRAREFGQTKYGGARYFHGFFDLLTVSFIGKYFNRPLHFFGLIGSFLFIIGLLINIYLTIGWFQGVWIGNRPILFLGVLMIVVGIQFFSIGLIGEMIVKSGRYKENRIEKVFTHKNINENISD